MEHNLKKVYGGILNKKTFTPTSFRSLTESYTSIYEADEPTTPPPVQSGMKFDKDKSKKTLTEWTQEQQNLYLIEDAKTGAGPGEASVASLISGKIIYDEVKNMISGQSVSFDVSFPSADEPTYKFEVKQEEYEEGSDGTTDKSVRIGVTGQPVGQEIIKKITNILSNIREEYDVLTPTAQDKVNDTLRNKITVSEPTAGVTKAGKPRLKPLSGDIRKHSQRTEMKSKWNVSDFINAVTPLRGEFPFTNVFEEKYKAKKTNSAARGFYTLMSLETLIDYISEQAGHKIEVDKEEEKDESGEESRVGSIKRTFKDYYGAPDSEKSEALDKEIEKEAENVDKRLIKAKIRITGEGGNEAEDFFKNLKKDNIKSKFEELKEYVKNPKVIRSLFPNGENAPVSIDGLFVVDPKGYRYFASDDIGHSIVITRISQGAPKIQVKASKDENV